MSLPTKITIRDFSRRSGDAVADTVKQNDLIDAPRSAMRCLAQMTGHSLAINEDDYVCETELARKRCRGTRSNAIRQMYEFAPHFTLIQDWAEQSRQQGYPEGEQLLLDGFSEDTHQSNLFD